MVFGGLVQNRVSNSPEVVGVAHYEAASILCRFRLPAITEHGGEVNREVFATEQHPVALAPHRVVFWIKTSHFAWFVR